jgi:hypothetical protein
MMKQRILTIYLIIIFLGMSFLSCVSFHQGNKKLWIEIVESGIYKSDAVSIVESDSSTSGYYEILGNTTLVRTTDSFKLEKDIEFGIWYVVHAEDNEYYEIELVIHHPTFFDKDRRKYTSFSKLTDRVKANTPRYIGTYLDKEYELVNGKWMFEIKYNNIIMAKKVFKIYK